jgi:hypothetical protein
LTFECKTIKDISSEHKEENCQQKSNKIVTLKKCLL